MKVGVIMGGISSEREISLKTGEGMIANIDKSKYEVYPIVLDSKEDAINKIKDIDFALIALHGKFGEDGTVQSILQTLNIPYSGCGPLSSALCMDKDITKKIVRAEGVRTADWSMVKSIEEAEALNSLEYPVVVKPNNGGSSVATNIVSNKETMIEAVEEALKYDMEVMIETYIKGDEITCSILDGEMLPVLAIKPKAGFFDFTSKYADGGADEFIVELNPELHKEVKEMALKCWKALKCSVYSRVDFIVKEGVPYFLEINTLPGMTKNSLLPKSAAGVNINFSQLLDKIIEYSLKEKRS